MKPKFEVVELAALPHTDALRRLQSHPDAPVYLPVNPVEYHGPHLPLYTDRIISHGILRRLHPYIAGDGSIPCFLAPDLPLGMDPTPGAGSVSCDYQEFRRQVLQAARGIAQMGVKKIIFMTFHGAPRHNQGLQTVADILEKRGIIAVNPLNILLGWMLKPQSADFDDILAPIAALADRERLAARMTMDFHAGFFETSLVLALAREAVHPDYRSLPPCPETGRPAWLRFLLDNMRRIGQEGMARELAYGAEALAWLDLKPFPGYTGEPALAEAEVGERILARLLPAYAKAILGCFSGTQPAPRPVMGISALFPAPTGHS